MRRYAPLNHEHDAATAPAWGAITGTLSAQTDLQTALDGTVKLTGNQTIAGLKTFTDTVEIQRPGSAVQRLLLFGDSGTLQMKGESSVTNAKNTVFDSTTNTGDAPTGGSLGYRFRTRGSDRMTLSESGGLWCAGDLSFGGTLTGGTVPWARLSGFAASTWMNDSEGNPRLYMYGNATTTNGIILRGSHPDHRFQFRNSANATVWEVNQHGALSIGDVPWARLSDVPTTFAPSAHTHAAHEVTVLGNRLAVDVNGIIRNNNTDYRRAGMYGLYDSYRVGHIWSMGSAYIIAENGSNFGNTYGLAYKHTNNTSGGTMAGGHQIVFCSNGTPGVAIRLDGGIWTKGVINLGGTTDTTLSRKVAGLLGVANRAVVTHANTGYNSAAITVSTSAPSGGADGDIWLKV